MISSSILELSAYYKSEITDQVFKKTLPTPVIMAYLLFGGFAVSVYHFVANGEYSSILTISVITQALGFTFLCVQVLRNKSARGISLGALILDGLSVALRIPATWTEAYIPVDETGDYIFQSVDLFAVFAVLFLIYQVLVVHPNSYQAAEDAFTVGRIFLGCLLLAAIFHPNAAGNVLFDILWMTGLFCGVAAVLPTFWLIQRNGGWAEGPTTHYIAAVAVSRALSGLFMWEAWSDVTCDKWHESFNHGIIFVLGAHAVQLLLLSDFACCYVKAALQKGCTFDAIQLRAPTGEYLV
jgi:hypothetical protein